MPAQMTNSHKSTRRRRGIFARLLVALAATFIAVHQASAYLAYVSNEKSNTISVIDTSRWEVVRTIKVGQRPRGIAITKDQRQDRKSVV